METIQVVLDSKLLRATERAARRKKLNRSAVIREALHEYLRRQEIRELEARDREGYEKSPAELQEWHLWEKEAAWPEV